MATWMTVANLTLFAALISAMAAVTSLVLNWRSKRLEEKPDISFKFTGRTKAARQIELTIRNPSRRTMQLHSVLIKPPVQFENADGSTSSCMSRSDFIYPAENLGLRLSLTMPDDFKSNKVELQIDIAAEINSNPKRYHCAQNICG